MQTHTDNLAEIIKSTRKTHNISLSQLGNLIGVPASTVKRWEEGSVPRTSHKLQIALVMHTINNPDMVYAELARHGIIINRKKWDYLANRIKGIESVTSSSESKFNSVDAIIIVHAVSGLMALIAQQYLSSVPPISKINKITKLLAELLK